MPYPGYGAVRRTGCQCRSGWYESGRARHADDVRETPRLFFCWPCRELDHRKLACPVYGDKKMLLAFSGLDLGDVEVEEPDRVAFEALTLRFVPFNVRQP